jgi:hypothetical protein
MDAKVNTGKQMEIFNFHDTFNTELYAGEMFTPDFFFVSSESVLFSSFIHHFFMHTYEVVRIHAKVNAGKQMEIFNFHDTFNTDLYAGEMFTPDFFSISSESVLFSSFIHHFLCLHLIFIALKN